MSRFDCCCCESKDESTFFGERPSYLDESANEDAPGPGFVDGIVR